ncbi:hypothetical protein HHX47_DHR1000526 [Lentinula edodes]|nr:hypothetical protein HHX47_DHR1000526 [Lentinula edodes]
MHALSIATFVLLSAAVTAPAVGYVVPRKETPSTYAVGYLEDYQTYHTRYLAIGCQYQHNNATFFNACCHPMLATETLETARPSYCIPSTSASASASAAEATSTATTPADGDNGNDNDDDDSDDCDDGDDDDSTSTSVVSTATLSSTSEAFSPTSSSAFSEPTTSSESSSTPTPTSTQETPTTPSSSAEATPTGSVDSSTGSSEVFTGGHVAGACGTVHSDNDFIVVILPWSLRALDLTTYLDQDRYGDSGETSQYCGKTVTITGLGKTMQATVADDCPTCEYSFHLCTFSLMIHPRRLGDNENSLDMSVALFQSFTSLDVGEFDSSAHNPTTFSDVLADVHGVVHTLGTLIEDGGKYKQAIREGNVTKMIGSALGSVFGFQNPLKGISEGSYEDINRDSALRVCEAFLSSGQGKQSPKPRPFVYISAEDVFRPIIPARYIETKREAEMGIEAMLSTSPPGQYRGVYIRPSLVYHAHYRPLTTPAAAIFDLSASLHRKIPQGIPKPSQLLHYLGAALSPQSSLSIRNARGPLKDASLGSPLDSIANAITIPPIHVDHVAEAIVIALEDSTVRGVVGVGRMRELIVLLCHVPARAPVDHTLLVLLRLLDFHLYQYGGYGQILLEPVPAAKSQIGLAETVGMVGQVHSL